MVVFNRDEIVKLTDAQIDRRCKVYRQDIHECELEKYLELDMATYGRLQTHHIRGGTVRRLAEANEPANYIAVSLGAHTWGHDNSVEFEVMCWYAKWVKWNRLCDVNIESLDWQPVTIDRLCSGGGLVGRIGGILLPKLTDAKCKCYAKVLLTALGE